MYPSTTVQRSGYMNPAVLIVDDEVSIRDSLREFLSFSSYTVDSVASAEEAMAVLSEKRFDVVITDIIMEGMDGLALMEAIKTSGDTSVIIMTGYKQDYTYESVIKKGADDFIFKPFRLEEMLLRLKRVLRERTITHQRNAALEEFRVLSITDYLTGLYNARHFSQQIQNEIIRHNRYRRPLSLLMIDIDYFKGYNDAYGHAEGDRILMMMGKAINAVLRGSDTAYRYGGEEFTLILPETRLVGALTAADRIKKDIESFLSMIKYGEGPITVSIGATEHNFGETAAEFLQRADKAMYLSKSRGRNCISAL